MKNKNKENTQIIFGSTFLATWFTFPSQSSLSLVKFAIASLQVFIFEIEHTLSSHLAQMCDAVVVASKY